MQVKTLLLAVCWIAVSFPSFARDKIALSSANNRSLKFVRNEGQIKNQHGHLRSELHSRMKAGKNLNVFTGAGLLVYQWQGSDMMYRMEATLIDASTDVQPVYEMPLSYMERYIGNGKEITARSCGRIVYTGVYPNIDWVLYTTTDGHLKYDFIVHPGGKVSDIQIKYSGATAISLKQDGSLSVQTPMGSIGEHAPVSYTREGKAVGSRFILNDSIVSFAVDDYLGTLVIDPELSWSTYKGGTANDFADAVATDLWGNIYTSGYTLSNDNIATTGAFQTTYEGSNVASNAGDAFITKYNCSGELVWATYYGGEAGERAWNVVADDWGHIYVAGFTNLLSGLPSTDNLATTGSHQSTAGGGDGDAFLVKLDSAGNRLWATYYGGTGREAAATIPVGLALDKSGYVYLCGTTNSTNAIATTGAHQATPGGGNDAFLVQFDTAGVRQWSTYYGGTGVDRGEAVICDTAGNVYLTGISNSATGIATTGAHQSTPGGGSDAFLVKFDVDGVRQWGTYYGGSGSTDQGMSLFTDTALNVYLAGRTNSATGIASTGSFQDTYGGGMYDAFLTKFDGDGIREWGTYFGGLNNGALQGYNALTGDSRGNIFMTGMARGTDSLATPGSFQETVSGADDGFIASFSLDGALDWATYYGGAGNDWFSGIAVDAVGNLYLAGGTTSDAAFATAGSDQDALSGGYDAFLLKFNDTASLVAIDTFYGAVTACADAEQIYSIDPVPGAISYNWTLPSGWSGNSDTTSIAVTLDGTSGVLSVKPVFPCAEGSAYSIAVEVIQAMVTPLSDTEGCMGDTLQLDAPVLDGLSWQWLLGDTSIAGATDSSLLVDASGNYSVVITKGSCTDTSEAVSITIHELPDVAIIVSVDTLKATVGFAAYQWYHEGTLIGGAVADRYMPLIDGSYSVKVTDTNGCEAMSEIVEFDKPTSLNDIVFGLGIVIQPNPATDLLAVKAGKSMEAVLRTIDGRKITTFNVPGTLDVSLLSSGVYVLQLTNAASGFSKSFKVVKSTTR